MLTPLSSILFRAALLTITPGWAAVLHSARLVDYSTSRFPAANREDLRRAIFVEELTPPWERRASSIILDADGLAIAPLDEARRLFEDRSDTRGKSAKMKEMDAPVNCEETKWCDVYQEKCAGQPNLPSREDMCTKMLANCIHC